MSKSRLSSFISHSKLGALCSMCFFVISLEAQTGTENEQFQQNFNDLINAKNALSIEFNQIRQQQQAVSNTAIQAEKAYQMALQENNAEAITIAEQALQNVQNALSHLNIIVEQHNQRIKAYNQLISAYKEYQKPVSILLKRSGNDNEASILKPGETLETGNEMAELLVSDNNQIQLDKKTQLSINAIDKKRSIYQLIKGRVHVLYRCIKSRYSCPNVRYRLSTVAVAVRGTEFDLQQDDQQAIITVYEGVVSIEKPDDILAVNINAGEKAFISSEGNITKMERFAHKPDQQNHWWQE